MRSPNPSASSSAHSRHHARRRRCAFEVETDGIRQSYVLIDTAGLRKTRRVDDSIEFFSVKRAEDSIARCDLAILVLDAEGGITEQDKKIADLIVGARKACIVVINKWTWWTIRPPSARGRDRAPQQEGKQRAPNTMTTLSEFGQWVQERLFFLDYAPVIFTSAKSGFHLDACSKRCATSPPSSSRLFPPPS